MNVEQWRGVEGMVVGVVGWLVLSRLAVVFYPEENVEWENHESVDERREAREISRGVVLIPDGGGIVARVNEVYGRKLQVADLRREKKVRFSSGSMKGELQEGESVVVPEVGRLAVVGWE